MTVQGPLADGYGARARRAVPGVVLGKVHGMVHGAVHGKVLGCEPETKASSDPLPR